MVLQVHSPACYLRIERVMKPEGLRSSCKAMVWRQLIANSLLIGAAYGITTAVGERNRTGLVLVHSSLPTYRNLEGSLVKATSAFEDGTFLSNIAAWPKQPVEVNPSAWIDNFAPGRDREIALKLLESWIFVSDDELRKAASSLLRSLSVEVLNSPISDPSTSVNWADFISELVISVPLAANQDLAASGYNFFRFARDLGFEEGQFLISAELVHKYATGSSRDLILIDDLSATGTQFIRSWKRRHTTRGGVTISLEQLADVGRLGRVYFLPIVATTDAVEEIRKQCPTVRVRPAYLLDETYSVAGSTSRLIPPEMQEDLLSLLDRYTRQTGHTTSKLGYQDLGLTLSFQHGTPNATLPIMAGPPTPPAAGWTYLRSS
jgi:hypothetical protein